MRGQTLLNMLDDGIDIAESDPFFCRQFQLPANPLFSKKKLTSDVAVLGWGVVESALSKSRPNCGWSLH